MSRWTAGRLTEWLETLTDDEKLDVARKILDHRKERSRQTQKHIRALNAATRDLEKRGRDQEPDVDFGFLMAAAQPKGDVSADWIETTVNAFPGAFDDVVYGLLAQDHISADQFRELTAPILMIAEGSLKRKESGG